MKRHYLKFTNRIGLIFLSTVLFFVSEVKAQSFQIVWGMNRTLSGASSSINFTPADASLFGAHPHSLPAVLYYSLGGGDYAYGTTYWLASPAGKYLNFSFSVGTYEYNLTSVSFRVRRSPDGPADISLRSSLDGFTSNLATSHLTTANIFYTVSAPMGLRNLSSGISFRIYGNNASTYLGVLYFDQIVINGTVTSTVLPVSLTYFNARLLEKNVHLSWETAWEKNSKEFVIERSTDLFEFTSIGSITAGGDASGRLQYNFVDDNPVSGVSYYRIKMVDKDANYNYSATRDIIIRSDSDALQVYPNPVSANQIRIFKNNIDPDALLLTNLTGQNITFTVADFESNFLTLLPAQPLPSGLYILSIFKNGIRQHAKVLVP
ncbi:T9SS type A sorting domain-containing protein [Dyadobacter sp. NIV53]|uniref:T9SS type A sorting domain-containing protein n=1 Tax=Dyadobacter sp. NIV53 TaxID=2861765 RepID=UPI001C86A9EE|nr:T9SS type A sorting domain-containing protein [Dyadobacter sp. NIV53]